MRRYAALAALTGILVAGCTSGTSGGSGTSGTTDASSGNSAGGTLRLLYDRTVTTWDPQRLAGGAESAVALRTFARTLTGYPAGADGRADRLAGDLATDTGSTPDGGRTWVFTLRIGPAWEDGTPVTCADVRYGIARAFARDQLTGGLPYPSALLDVPTQPDPRGAPVPVYPGPYATTDPTATAAFDSAVTCAGQTLTLRLRATEPDFPHILALPVFAAHRADHDRGAAGTLDVFSCGPYRLEAPWEPGSGGRFVRNPAWTAASDPLRRAAPEVVDLREGIPVATIASRLAEDKQPDDTAVSLADLPVSTQAALLADPAIAARVSTPASGLVELLQPNFASTAMGNRAVRVAFATATDRTAFAAAYGPRVFTPAYAVLPAAVPGHVDSNPLGVPEAGDPVAARAALVAAGIALPVAVRVAYRGSAVADSAFAALKAGWEEAGFAVTLEAVPDPYYATVSAPEAAARFDVFRASWYPDYPEGVAVIPELFDSRLNLTSAGAGQDLGSFSDPTVNAAIDTSQATLDPAARAAAWAAVDASLVTAGVAVPLGERHRFFVRGSGVTAYGENPALGGWPDLAAIVVRS